MEDIGDSRATKNVLLEIRRPTIIAAPKDYFLGPVFAATPQTGAREVIIGNHRYVIGGFHPMGGDIHQRQVDDVQNWRRKRNGGD